jgi:competence protein ComEC
MLSGAIVGALCLLVWPMTTQLTLWVNITLAFVFFSYGFYRRNLFGMGVCLGLISVLWTIIDYRHTSAYLPTHHEYITIIGEVNSLSVPNNSVKNITFTVLSIDDRHFSYFKQPIIRIYNDIELPFLLGEKWALRVKLSHPMGNSNQGGFDKERFFVSQGWHGEASLRSGSRLSSSDSFRQNFLNRIWFDISDLPYAATLLALSFGDRSQLDREWRETLQQSGLAHLLAISGLHIGWTFLLGYGLLLRLRGEKNVPILGLWVGGLAMAFGYAYLAGWGISTIRAWGVCALFVLLKMIRIRWSHGVILLFLFASCLLVFPLSVFQLGFWLSFSAVTAIGLIFFFWGHRLQHLPHWQKLFYVQCGIFCLLMPIQLLIFDGISVLSILSNLVAIPLVSLVTVPCVLFALILSVIGVPTAILWGAANYSLLIVDWIAQWGQIGWWSLMHKQSVFYLLLLLSVVIIVFLWRIRCRVFSGFCALLFSLSLWSWQSEQRGWRLHFLDVGHGLATVIERNNRTVLFDTGVRWPEGSMAERVILPFLSYQGLSDAVDGIILSHSDSDHAGGFDVLKRTLDHIGWLRQSQRGGGSLPCIQNTEWQWQGLQFNVLWPPKFVERAENRHSCVVLVSDENISSVPTRVLLTGDVDAVGELLFIRHPWARSVDIVQVPHHGSKTSSTVTWLKQAKPHWAVVSVGNNRRWNLPHPEIRHRYKMIKSHWLSTLTSGQITFTILNGVQKVVEHRSINQRWFHARPSG